MSAPPRHEVAAGPLRTHGLNSLRPGRADHPVRAADKGLHQPRQPLPHVYSLASTITYF
jgi:hypothetical protein